MKGNKKHFCLFSVIILLIALAVFLLIDFGFIFQNEEKGVVEIQAEPLTYSAYMSSTVGIGLVPVYTTSTKKEAVKFHWNTNYGYFVSWGIYDYTVRLLGKEVINNGEKIYWSYDPNDAQVEKKDVLIHLWVESASSGKVLAKAVLKIKWKDTHTAEVSR